MHNIWLIAKREYLERIRTKAFLIATILIPLFMGAFVFGSGYLASRTKSSAHIAIVSPDKSFSADLKQELQTGKNSGMTIEVLAPTSPSNSNEIRANLDRNLQSKSGDLTGYLVVTPAPQPNARPTFTYVPRSAGDITTEDTLSTAIQNVLTREGLTHQGMGPSDIAALMAPVAIDTSKTGDSRAAFGAAYLLFFLMYMVIMLYGMNTARSIIEEKTSRVFEVMLSTIKPDEMLAGKILGVGAVGITQVGVWMLAAAALGSTSLATGVIGSGHALISATQIFFFVAYFIFGFLVYSSIAAALGAMTNSEQELQQLNMFLVIPLAFCFLMIFVIVRAPNSTLAQIVSLIPFCSPLLMNFRISLTTVPPWQIGLSFVLMSLTILAILWVASRIYRVGILMYGKKPNLPEILRWLKYS
ncbi:ABC transporter permease [Tunturiibacter gelidoferens]|uniref:ABC-2 type transport system permease protein n=1 Tax=Tunturiibacter lichenicola TaxID=2051959 RepID=A0A7Y9NLT0_9BACT|nr:ABC transporter permease [Edaphobacter lichenicola]NYF51170.1 ABC-2 type transport system permease protein [Edaphobacter lichenicola]